MLKIFILLSLISFLTGCKGPQETNTVITPTEIKVKQKTLKEKVKISIGKFSNRSSYMNGVFSTSEDRLGLQARQILKNHLSQSKNFIVLDRVNLDEIKKEAGFENKTQKISGSQWVITGAVTEFGRKEVGTKALGGLFGKSKSQVAYGKISLSIIDVDNSAVLFSVQGAGEYQLTQNETLGFGSTAGYDSTLTDKVINLAMIEAVDRLIEALADEGI